MIREFRATGSEWWLSASCGEAPLVMIPTHRSENEDAMPIYAVEIKVPQIHRDASIVPSASIAAMYKSGRELRFGAGR
jgi:hypothetical protein